MPVLKCGIETLPLFFQLGRLELDEIGRVVAAGDKFAGHVVDVLNASGATLRQEEKEISSQKSGLSDT